MDLRWLWRMALWARRPPSARQVRFFLAILAITCAIALVEHFAGWPEALTPTRPGLP
jgi:hypothetical protein